MDIHYSEYAFISPCCHMFNYYDGNYIYCSQCRKLIHEVKGDEVLSISVKFNNNLKNNISGDIVNSFLAKVPRFSTDPTCELSNKICEKCKSRMRYLRDPQGNLIYVCSNGECRYVSK